MSIHGDIKNPSGHGPGQLALGGSAWAGGLVQVISRGAFQPEPVCGSVGRSMLRVRQRGGHWAGCADLSASSEGCVIITEISQRDQLPQGVQDCNGPPQPETGRQPHADWSYHWCQWVLQKDVQGSASFRKLVFQRILVTQLLTLEHLGELQTCCTSSSWLCYGEWHVWLLPAQVPRGAGWSAFMSQVYIWALLWNWSKKLARTLWNYLFKIFFFEGNLFLPIFSSAKVQVYTGDSHLQLNSRGVTTEWKIISQMIQRCNVFSLGISKNPPKLLTKHVQRK